MGFAVALTAASNTAVDHLAQEVNKQINNSFEERLMTEKVIRVH